MSHSDLKAPFPWFGGKRRVADPVWRAFGPDVANFVEPFAGSLAVLLGRPGGAGKIETVNDLDRWLANFWRAVTAEPDEVARWADWPVNEADLHARHLWLVNQEEFREKMHTDPNHYDVKIAGWWVWGICQWIGGGWCVEPENKTRPRLDGIGKGIHSDAARVESPTAHWRKRPVLDGTAQGRGVHSDGGRGAHLRQRPHMSGDSSGMGVHVLPQTSSSVTQKRQLPKLSVTDGAAGIGGVHAAGLPSLGNDRGLNGVTAAPCVEWFRDLQNRLRRVRVACGDWKRVLGPSVLGKGKNVGGRRPCAVFLDPPYSHDVRARHLYAEESGTVSHVVRDWALEHGDDPDLRIALCGYLVEHDAHMPASWRRFVWKAGRGYAGEGNDNREEERIWFSPHCLSAEQGDLFNRAGASA